MNPSLEKLMSEHALILKVLSSLESCIRCTLAGEPLSRSVVADYVDFIVRFADKYHHAKEEELLFVEMLGHGFSRESGPIAVMLNEHDQGRAFVSVLKELAKGDGLLSSTDAFKFADVGRGYMTLLRAHIEKEDNVLYPMASRALPPERLSVLDAGCSAVDAREVATVETLVSKAHSLLTRYPVGLEPMDDDACSSGCNGCQNFFCESSR